MLRLIFVTILVVAGAVVAAQSAFLGLLFYLWNAYFRPDDWSYGGVIGSLHLSLIIAVYVVMRTVALLPSPRINGRTLLFGLFFAQAAFSAYMSENQWASAQFLWDFAKVMVITYLIVVLVNDRQQFRLVLLVIALSLGFETAKQGWVNLVRSPGAANTNSHIFLGDNNGVAMGTMMLLPILGALAQTSKQRSERWMHRFVAVGVLLRGITTYSRGGFLGAAALGGILILRSERKLRAIVVVAALGLLVWNTMPQAFWDRMDTITIGSGQERDDSASGRLHFWNVAVDMANAKPMTGVGLDGFSRSYEGYNTNTDYPGQRAAHSIWFGVLAELGYTGLILFVANLGMALWSCWRIGRLSKPHKDLRDLRIFANALISSLVVFAMAGSFLSYQYSEMVWHIFGLSTALYLITVKEVRELPAASRTRRAA